ncbi:helix-turn-helix domain-containing protein [Streptomyces radicis]|uniref:XRE family transcriptional regulator n=1 Tax=Streptomyces radicis TaxID=1750517 RepID=A0A3A9WDA9_9ACTN|nr:helix-turn-helix transcriptional regulator [Streptomyces radicis]RKN11058.1 XRE family transcriptional regulator [Streptomyces radicis]RKN25321.1 XRE family transcriptional regulator [Streptomyces radicis]
MPDQLRDDMREARRASGMTWAKFAREAGFGEAYLRNVENGNRSVTSGVAAAYDRVLHTGGTFTAALGDGSSRVAKAVAWDQPGSLTVLADLLRGSNVDRRGFLSAGATLSVSASNWANALEPIQADGRPAPLPSGRALSAHVDDRLDHLRHLDDELGSGEVYQLARSELSLIVKLIASRRYGGATVDHLHAMASEAARQVAWAAFDQSRPGVAQRFFDGSLRASAEAGDPISGAYALSFAAIQCYSTPGQAGRAVSLLQTAQEQVRHKATPRMHAMLAARTARALSKTGAKKECAHQLHLARAALDKGPHDDDPKTLYWVDHGEIEMIAGSAALHLGDPAEALRRFETAVQASYPGDEEYPRSHAIYLSRAAEAHLALHDLDAAVATARHAARCLGSVDSARSASELKGLREKLAPHAGHPAVREFLQVG